MTYIIIFITKKPTCSQYDIVAHLS